MLAPCSANRRCRKALRYFVLSYVTKPTTIKAITTMPANTPRPMGRTDKFLPGIWNLVVGEEEEASEAFGVAVEVPVPVAGDGVTFVADGVALELDAELLGVAVETGGDGDGDDDGVGDGDDGGGGDDGAGAGGVDGGTDACVPGEILQSSTSCTAALPELSVIGLRVITQVCVTGPSTVFMT